MKTKEKIAIIVSMILLIALFLFAAFGKPDVETTNTSDTLATTEQTASLAKLDKSNSINTNFDTTKPYIIIFYDQTKAVSYDLYQGYLQATTEDQTIVPYIHFVEYNNASTTLKEQFVVAEPSIVFYNGDLTGKTEIKNYSANDFQSYFTNLNRNTFRNTNI